MALINVADQRAFNIVRGMIYIGDFYRRPSPVTASIVVFLLAPAARSFPR